MLLTASACTMDDADLGEPCGSVAVVTDIDGTLTLSDLEFLQQLTNASYDPVDYPDAAALMQAYDALGYDIVYMTARGEDLTLEDGRSSREATADWLDAHGYPDGPLFLADGVGAFGDSAERYKVDRLTGLQATGTTFAVGYGNSRSDIDAFLEVGIPTAYAVGPDGPDIGGTVIPEADTFTAHLASLHIGPACP